MKNTEAKKKRRRVKKQELSEAKQSSFAEANSENNINQQKNENDGQARLSNNNAQVETAGDNADPSLPMPYEFLKFASPPLHTIFVPHFTVKSINFVLSMVYVVTFIVFLVFNYVKPQSDITWNCSLVQVQTKYFPKLRYNIQLWRVITSALFHSNIPHFALNIFGLQIYGYFIEWYYGKIKYAVTAVVAIIIAHFLSCVAENTSISTTTSSILFSFLALKLVFFFQYWDYKPLINRKIFLYLLFCLILGINLIPIFVSNNVDYSVYIGGFVVGILLGVFFHLKRRQQSLQEGQQLHIGLIILKWSMPFLLFAIAVAFIAVTFVIDSQNLQALNQTIDQKCQQIIQAA